MALFQVAGDVVEVHEVVEAADEEDVAAVVQEAVEVEEVIVAVDVVEIRAHGHFT